MSKPETPELSKVGVRVPPFCPDDPALWFAQVEGQFVLAGITADSTKFYYITAQLEQRYALEVKDIITNPPETEKYKKLKEELVSRLSASQERKVQQLLTHEEMGSRKPSQFLRHLQQLAGTAVTDEFLRTLWAGRLPVNIQTVVAAAQSSMSLNEVSLLADKVYDIVPCTTQVASTSGESHMSLMTRQISELTKQVASLQSKLDSRSRSRSRPRNTNKPRSRSRSRPVDPSVCFYHNRFRQKAHKCVQPCNYKPAGNASGSRN